MRRYKALKRQQHDGQRFEVGAALLLSKKEAAARAADGRVQGVPIDDEPLALDPESSKLTRVDYGAITIAQVLGMDLSRLEAIPREVRVDLVERVIDTLVDSPEEDDEDPFGFGPEETGDDAPPEKKAGGEE